MSSRKRKPIFVAIVGLRNAGKSTVIKCLTGCPRSTSREKIYDSKTGRSIYAVCSSPQEDQLPAMTQSDLEDTFNDVYSDKLCNGLVMALQPTNPTKRLSWEYILDQAAKHSFQIFAFVLSPDYAGKALSLKKSLTLTSGMKVPLTHIDGRRFAQINAGMINRISRIAA